MKKKTVSIELIIRFWPIVVLIASLIGSYYTVKFTMRDHEKRLDNIEGFKSKVWERLGNQSERIARLEGRL